MNTVEALNVLGKALCGDSFEVKPGLTDAETILEIAKNYTGGGSGGGGDSVRIIDITDFDSAGEPIGTIEPGLTPDYFVNAAFKYFNQSDDPSPRYAKPTQIISNYAYDGSTATLDSIDCVIGNYDIPISYTVSSGQVLWATNQ